MNLLVKRIEARIEELGWQQKQLAHEWRERSGKGELDTFVTRLSKLMNDEEEGYRFLQERTSALAEALGWSESELVPLAETARARITLVLSERVSPPQRAFLKRREELANGAFSVAELGDFTGDPLIAIRDVARRKRNPVVIVPDDRDKTFFEGADLRTSRIEAAEVGFRLPALPDLLPTLPARLHDVDGMPMVPDDAKGTWSRRYVDEPNWAARIAACHAEGVPATFRLDWILGDHSRPSVDELKRLLSILVRKQETTIGSYTWLHGHRILAFGPDNELRQRIRNAGHPIHEVHSFDILIDAICAVLRDLNPDLEGGDLDAEKELSAFTDETGIQLELTMEELREALWPKTGRKKFARGPVARLSASLDSRIRELLDGVLAREFILPKDCREVPFYLEAAREAPLVHFDSPDGVLHCAANVGAGRVIDIVVNLFAREKPTAIQLIERNREIPIMDGGDIRITMSCGAPREALEGATAGSVARRREEAARARYDDDD